MAAAEQFFGQFDEGGKYEGEADSVTYLSSRHAQDMDTEVSSVQVKQYENDNEPRFGDNYVQFHLKVTDIREGVGYERVGGEDLNPSIDEGDTVTIQFSFATDQTKGQAKRQLLGFQKMASLVTGEDLTVIRKEGVKALERFADPEAHAGAGIRITTPKDKQNESKGVTYFNPVFERID